MRGSTIRIAGIFAVLSLVLSALNAYAADQVCSFKLTACPEDFNDSTIYVPKKVTYFSPNFHVCEPSFTIEDVVTSKNPPSIMFVIDHSTSMSTGGSGLGSSGIPQDSGGVRFRVTAALLDSIYKTYPDAEVGLTIFEKYLWINAEDNPNYASLPESYFEQYPLNASEDVYKTQGYIPLLKLDSTVQGDQKGIDVLKNMLEVKHATVGSADFESAVPVYEPKWLPELTGGTNINVAFDATRFAMQKSSYPKENQYVIFLSDGEPNSNWPRPGSDFEKGTDMPTTFTVYFTTKGTVPASIAKMTDNIKANAYSTSNEKSWYYAMQASYDSLLTRLMTDALTPMMRVVTQTPKRLKINGVTYTDYREADSVFYLNGGLKLSDSVSKFTVEINYLVHKDTSSEPYDSLVKSGFTVIRSDEVKQNSNIELVDCRDTLYYSVSVSASDAEAGEENKNSGKIEFKRTNQDLGDLTVYFTISGTATRKADYTDINYDSIVFPKGTSAQSIEIVPVADELKEGDETVIVTLLSVKGGKNIRYSIGTISAEVKIKDAKQNDTTDIAVLINPFSTVKSINTQLAEIKAQGKISPEIIGNLSSLVNGAEHGTIISIQTTTPLKEVGKSPSGNTMYAGSGKLYDAVGNLVNTLSIYGVDPKNGIYGMFWDGTNKNHRKVGSGVYLAKIVFRNEDNSETKRSYKIGVID